MLTILSVLVMIMMAFSAVFASSSVSASGKREWKQIFLYSFIAGVIINCNSNQNISRFYIDYINI